MKQLLTSLILLIIWLDAPTALGQDVGESPTSVTLRWTAPGDDGGSGRAAAYDLRYATDNLTESNWHEAFLVECEPAPHTAATVESCTVEGLFYGVTYYFALKTTDEAFNWSPMSNVFIVRLVDTSGSSTGADDNAPGAMVPEQLELSQNYPNPFNLSTTIKYNIPRGSLVTISIFNIFRSIGIYAG